MLTFLAIAVYASIALGVGVTIDEVWDQIFFLDQKHRTSVTLFWAALWPVFIIAVVVKWALKP